MTLSCLFHMTTYCNDIYFALPTLPYVFIIYPHIQNTLYLDPAIVNEHWQQFSLNSRQCSKPCNKEQAVHL